MARVSQEAARKLAEEFWACKRSQNPGLPRWSKLALTMRRERCEAAQVFLEALVPPEQAEAKLATVEAEREGWITKAANAAATIETLKAQRERDAAVLEGLTTREAAQAAKRAWPTASEGPTSPTRHNLQRAIKAALQHAQEQVSNDRP